MIGVKEAVRLALDYMKEFSQQELDQLRLEEVEISEDEKSWLVTVSYLDDQAMNPFQKPRAYKLITIDSATGAFKSLKIRT